MIFGTEPWILSRCLALNQRLWAEFLEDEASHWWVDIEFGRSSRWAVEIRWTQLGNSEDRLRSMGPKLQDFTSWGPVEGAAFSIFPLGNPTTWGIY